MYTHFFAFGFLYAFEAVFKGYPVPNEWVALFEAAARSAGFGVLLRCAAAALSVCCVKRDCAFSALLMRGADALLNTC